MAGHPHFAGKKRAIFDPCGASDNAALVAARFFQREHLRDNLRKTHAFVRRLQSRHWRGKGVKSAAGLRNSCRKRVGLRRLARLLDEAERQDVSREEARHAYSEDMGVQLIRCQCRAQPDQGTRALLRMAGFKPTGRHAYERHLDDAGIASARMVRNDLYRGSPYHGHTQHWRV